MSDRVCTSEEARTVEEWERGLFLSHQGMADFVREAIREQVAEWEAKDEDEEV